MIDMSEWANGSHNSFGDAIYMATLSTVLVFAVLGVVWRAGRRLALRATHRIPRDAQPLLEDTKFVICLALVCGFGLLLTLNPGLLVLPKDTTFTGQLTSSPRFKPGDSSYRFAVGEVLVSKRLPRIRV